MKKILTLNSRRKFKIINPNWAKPIEAEGTVSEVQENRLNGMVLFTDVKILDDMLIRFEQIL